MLLKGVNAVWQTTWKSNQLRIRVIFPWLDMVIDFQWKTMPILNLSVRHIFAVLHVQGVWKMRDVLSTGEQEWE